MNPAFAIARRNCTIFFRDKPGVFFSMLGVLIVLMLYVLFLRNMMLSNYDMPGGEFLMDSWIMAGMLAVSSITAALGSFGILINDKVSGSSKTMNVAPVTPLQRSAGYVLSSFVITMAMCMITLVFAEVYILAYGGELLSPVSMLKVLGIVLLGTASSCAIMFFITSFLKTTNAFATVSTTVGTLVGFLTGVYIPMGSMPDAVQTIIKMMPGSHEASLLRQIFVEVPEERYFEGVPADVVHQFDIEMGNIFSVGGADMDPWMNIAVLAGTAILFLVLSAWSISRRRQ